MDLFSKSSRLFFFVFSFLFFSSFTLIEDQALTPLLHPKYQEYKKKKIVLKNGIEVLLISNTSTDKCGALLSLNVGSLYDPIDSPGFFHFLEHMLFLGTKSYPSNKAYTSYIKEHGGLFNGRTGPFSSAYFFTISPSYYEEGLNRFASCLKEPLFDPLCFQSEKSVVEEEYRKNKNSDSFKFLHVLKAMAATDNPFHNFSIGSIDTLSKVDQNLFFSMKEKYYVGKRMKLCLISNEPLDSLEKKAVLQFESIPAGTLSSEKSSPLFPDSLKGSLTFIEGKNKGDMLNVLFPLVPPFARLSDENPFMWLDFLITHKGENSLYDVLKKEELISSLSSSTLPLASDSLLYFISFNLTKKGANQKEKILQTLFAALSFYEKIEPSETLLKNFQEEMLFQYQTAAPLSTWDFFQENSMDLVNEPLATFPERKSFIRKLDKDVFKKFLKFLKKENALFFFLSSSPLPKNVSLEKEPFTETSYGTLKNFLASQKEETFLFSYPLVNPFITPPSKEKIILSPNPPLFFNLTPKKVLDEEGGLLYTLEDPYWKGFTASFSLEIKTPEALLGKETAPFIDLYLLLLKKELEQILYQAEKVQFSVNFIKTNQGIFLRLDGKESQMETFLPYLLESLPLPHLSLSSFKEGKETLLKFYENGIKKDPIDQSMECFFETLFEKYPNFIEKKRELKKVNLSNFKIFIDNLFNESYFEGFFVGKEKSTTPVFLFKSLQKALQKKPYLTHKEDKPLLKNIENQKEPLCYTKNTDVLGSASLLAFKAPSTLKNDVLTELTSLVLSPYYFNEIRTKKKMGYLVRSTPALIQQYTFLHLVIQSGSKAAPQLLWTTENILDCFYDKDHPFLIEEPAFKEIQASLLEEYVSSPQSVEDLHDTFRYLAFTFDGDFNITKRKIELLKQIKLSDLKEFCYNLFSPVNTQRTSVLIQGKCTETIPFIEYKKFTKLKKEGKK